MPNSKDETLRMITYDYLSNIDLDNPPDAKTIQSDILEETAKIFQIENSARQTGTKWRIPDKLQPAQIADILLTIYPIANIACAGINADTAYDLLSIYQTYGPNYGIYLSNEQLFHNLIHDYCYTLSTRETQDVMVILKDRAIRKTRCNAKNLIAVNNGIFDYDTKTLLPFSPDYVFIAKSKVNYNPNAVNPVIHNDEDNTDWNIEDWMKELFEDEDTRNTIWQILGAIIRPNVPWNKSAWFYSNTGNNGKGTLCELMRQLSGEGSYASIPLSDFSKDFMLEPLTRATSIIVDENDVGTFIDKAANLKAIITNDVIQMNRKFKTPIAFQFKGFMVQCLNEMPRIKDKSDSFYRRQLFIPFQQCFTGKERKYIKHDYLHRQDVLEYVLYKVLHMNYYTLTEPEICKEALEEYKTFNDPIRQFLDEVVSECVWDLLPFQFLYDLYKAWFKINNPNGIPQGRNTFITDLINTLPYATEWTCYGQKAKVRTGTKINQPEPLILQYNLQDWMNKSLIGNADPNARCIPKDVKSMYRGLVRITSTASNDVTDD